MAVERLFSGFPDMELIYIHDTSIEGLVSAKNESLKFVIGDLIGFLDDDVI